ncbi:CalY family protein [Acidimicrobiia bacterium EGI L10123]|uniref:TasA family protein n=1 Tax=Salinilacustrithrix flava TaxID=2957203 RepID=UPI003D7C2D2A|nr:CalY family protein [Acidimicrobiia bacterium EGI L10123]
MNKRKIGRLAGFVAAAGMTAGLVGGGVSMTGAYFQDTETGSIQGSTGEVDIKMASGTTLNTNFANLMPGGAPSSKTYTVKNVGTEAVDLYVDLSAGMPPGLTAADAATLQSQCGYLTFAITGDLGSTTLDACQLFTMAAGGPVKVADNVAASTARTVTVAASLDEDAGNVWASRSASGTIELIATQDGQTPTVQADQAAANDDQ